MASSQDLHPRSVGEALDHLGRLSLRDLSMSDLLQTVAELAKSVMPGEPEASVTLLVRDRPNTVAWTGRLAQDLDVTQFGRGQGPCLHAARSGELVEVADTRTDDRWPDYTSHAVQRGALSSLSVPLAIDTDDQVTGALTLYARAADAFDEDARAAAARIGPHAAAAAGNLRAYRSARAAADNLRIALESRTLVELAKGVLMERHKITPEQAFSLLTWASNNTDRRVRDIAEHLVTTGEFPVVPQHRDRSRRPAVRHPGRPVPATPSDS